MTPRQLVDCIALVVLALLGIAATAAALTPVDHVLDGSAGVVPGVGLAGIGPWGALAMALGLLSLMWCGVFRVAADGPRPLPALALATGPAACVAAASAGWIYGVTGPMARMDTVTWEWGYAAERLAWLARETSPGTGAAAVGMMWTAMACTGAALATAGGRRAAAVAPVHWLGLAVGLATAATAVLLPLLSYGDIALRSTTLGGPGVVERLALGLRTAAIPAGLASFAPLILGGLGLALATVRLLPRSAALDGAGAALLRGTATRAAGALALVGGALATALATKLVPAHEHLVELHLLLVPHQAGVVSFTPHVPHPQMAYVHGPMGATVLVAGAAMTAVAVLGMAARRPSAWVGPLLALVASCAMVVGARDTVMRAVATEIDPSCQIGCDPVQRAASLIVALPRGTPPRSAARQCGTSVAWWAMTVDLALLDTERCPQPGPHVVVSTDAISASDQLVSPLLSGRPDVTFVDPGSGTLRPLRRWLDDPRVAGQPVMLDVDASVPFGTVAMVLRTAAAAGAVPVEFIVLHPDRAMLYPLRTARLICPPAIPAATPWGEAISRCTVAEGDVSADE